MKTGNSLLGLFKNVRTLQPLLALAGLLSAAGTSALAVTVTVNPISGSAGVSTSTQVVFTFSEAMNTSPDATTFTFINFTTFTPVPAATVWNPAGTVATVSPAPSWPANATIFWNVSGETWLTADTIDEIGTFATSGSSSGGGTGTNAVTSFSVGVYHWYEQTNTAAPVLNLDYGYGFRAGTILASNRTANAVTVTPPGLLPISLNRSQFQQEMFSFFDSTNNLTAFNAKYPAGAYQFLVTAAASNQQINVTLSNPTQQPNAPHVVNYAAAQAVNAAQSFTLSWDPFIGGTANDFIIVEVGTDFKTPDAFEQGALNGTATSVVIPADALRPATDYTATIYFARLNWASNGTTSVTSAERVTLTEFSLKTTGGSTAGTALTNVAAVLPGQFRFQVQATAGQALFVESSVTLVSNSWTTVYTTNAVGPLTTITLPMTPPGRQFFRVRTN